MSNKTESLVFGIDYDNTITRDRELFETIIKTFLDSNHKVLVVTGRNESEPIDTHFKNLVTDVVYCSNEFKSTVTKKLGYKVDIWLDDEPGHIEPQRKLYW